MDQQILAGSPLWVPPLTLLVWWIAPLRCDREAIVPLGASTVAGAALLIPVCSALFAILVVLQTAISHMYLHPLVEDWIEAFCEQSGQALLLAAFFYWGKVISSPRMIVSASVAIAVGRRWALYGVCLGIYLHSDTPMRFISFQAICEFVVIMSADIMLGVFLAWGVRAKKSWWPGLFQGFVAATVMQGAFAYMLDLYRSGFRLHILGEHSHWSWVGKWVLRYYDRELFYVILCVLIALPVIPWLIAILRD